MNIEGNSQFYTAKTHSNKRENNNFNIVNFPVTKVFLV
jgi:hypothetical protein